MAVAKFELPILSDLSEVVKGRVKAAEVLGHEPTGVELIDHLVKPEGGPLRPDISADPVEYYNRVAPLHADAIAAVAEAASSVPDAPQTSVSGEAEAIEAETSAEDASGQEEPFDLDAEVLKLLEGLKKKMKAAAKRADITPGFELVLENVNSSIRALNRGVGRTRKPPRTEEYTEEAVI